MTTTRTTTPYTVVIEPTDTGYSAYAPDIPGCIATAATSEEILTEIASALAFHLEGLREYGEPIPASSSTAAVVEVVLETADAR